MILYLSEAINKCLSFNSNQNVVLLRPKNEEFGDIAINVNQLTAQLGDSAGAGISPEEIVEKLQNSNLFDKVEQSGSFINMSVNLSTLIKCIHSDIADESLHIGKKIMIEFSHANTLKVFHIGHLRNTILGEAISRILTSQKASVIRVNYQGDVGLHIAKTLYALMRDGITVESLEKIDNLEEKIKVLGTAYRDGNSAYESDENAKLEIQNINKKIFTHDPELMPLWEKTRQYSLDYFDIIYARLLTHFDRFFFESEVADRGVQLVKDGLSKGIFKEDAGAIILDGEKNGVDTRVFINSFGLPTYEAKEIGLAELEFTEFGEIDQCIHVVAHEQSSFFKTTFKAEELLNESRYKGKQTHFAYGFVDLKHGKMSSRTGNVVAGMDLVDEVKEKIKKQFTISEETAEVLAIASVKYGFLKVEAVKNIQFNIDESISLHGNSGLYLLYTYARCKTLLTKAGAGSYSLKINDADSLAPEEKMLLRTLAQFHDALHESAKTLSPHTICTYLYQLTQKFNTLYDKLPILKSSDEEKARRLALVHTTAETIKNGLDLLGVDTVESL